MWSWIVHLALFGLLVAAAPAALFDPLDPRSFVLLGLVGAWRYGWGAVHLVRSLVYRHLVFPRWRRLAESRWRAFDGLPPEEKERLLPHVFLVITSYRYPTEATAACYRAAIGEAVRYGGRVTVVASLVEPADRRLVKEVFRALAPPERVKLVLVELPPFGKREALAAGLVAVSRRMPRPHDVVAVMDGDTVLTPRCLRRSVPFLSLFPDVGGVTTDEAPLPRGGPPVHAWFVLRFARRHLYMSSVALSRRLLVMTGRFSLFPAAVATDPAFVARVREDHIDHWRLGRIRLLTGDDKSTWLSLLERGRSMVYVPDVCVLTTESLPHRRFPVGATQLMWRWFGNMLRAGRAALALGPARTGPFLWWCLVDQRVSAWTPLVGPVAIAMLAVLVHPLLLYAYLLWVLLTRTLLVLGLAAATGRRLSGLSPLLLWFDQVYGALVKTTVLFRLDRQMWTRQRIRADAAGGPWRAASAWFAQAVAYGALVLAVGLATGFFELPPAMAVGGGS